MVTFAKVTKDCLQIYRVLSQLGDTETASNVIIDKLLQK